MSSLWRLGLPLLAGLGAGLLSGLIPVPSLDSSHPASEANSQRRRLEVATRALSALACGGVGAVMGFALFGSIAAVVALGLLAMQVPRHVRDRAARTQFDNAIAAWPLVLEETRVRVSGSGQSLPAALFESGHTTALGPHLAAAGTTWGISTNFEKALKTLRSRVADPVTDSVVETLLAVYLAGAVNCDQRLSALIADRRDDLDARREAEARRSGVEFSRRFVLAVPAAMALVASLFGSGRQAFTTSTGQQLTVVAIATTAACWLWSGRLSRIPDRPRVFL